MLTLPGHLAGDMISLSAMAGVRRQARIPMTIDDLMGGDPGSG